MATLDHTTRAPGTDRSVDVPWRLVLGVWLLPAIADVADVYFSRRLAGTPLPLWRTVAWVFPGWYVWVLLSAGALWVATYVPLSRPLRVRTVIVHVAAAIAAALVHALVMSTARFIFDPPRQRPWPAELVMSVQDWAPISLVLYGLTLGAAHALLRVRASRAQEQRAAALEARLAQAELAVLRSQLEPHFLFNALNTAVSLVRAGDGAAGVDVLTRLGELLRHLLQGVGQETTVAEELLLLEWYVGIERARFGARLSIAVDVPTSLHDALVPSLSLQPLVENALRHGVGRRDAPGHVHVSAHTDGATLLITVRDDGPGLAAADGRSHGSGVALRNMRDRLARLYGGDATLSLTGGATGGAEARLRVPLRRQARPSAAEPARPVEEEVV